MRHRDYIIAQYVCPYLAAMGHSFFIFSGFPKSQGALSALILKSETLPLVEWPSRSPDMGVRKVFIFTTWPSSEHFWAINASFARAAADIPNHHKTVIALHDSMLLGMRYKHSGGNPIPYFRSPTIKHFCSFQYLHIIQLFTECVSFYISRLVSYTAWPLKVSLISNE